MTTHLPTPEGWMAELAMVADYSGRLTHKVVIVQLAVRRRIGKVRRPRPAFYPLCYAAKKCAYMCRCYVAVTISCYCMLCWLNRLFMQCCWSLTAGPKRPAVSGNSEVSLAMCKCQFETI